ncbi:MAG: hypothetical protein QM784_38640 [Polyangiaceae bacterium]
MTAREQVAENLERTERADSTNPSRVRRLRRARPHENDVEARAGAGNEDGAIPFEPTGGGSTDVSFCVRAGGGTDARCVTAAGGGTDARCGTAAGGGTDARCGTAAGGGTDARCGSTELRSARSRAGGNAEVLRGTASMRGGGREDWGDSGGAGIVEDPTAGRGWGMCQNLPARAGAADTIEPARRGGGNGMRSSLDGTTRAGGGCELDSKSRVLRSCAVRMASRSSGTVSSGTQLSMPSDHASTLCGVRSRTQRSARQSLRSSNRK